MSTSPLTLVAPPAARSLAMPVRPFARLRTYGRRVRRRFLFAPSDFDFSGLAADWTSWIAQLTERNR